jgi:hypothetical protein
MSQLVGLFSAVDKEHAVDHHTATGLPHWQTHLEKYEPSFEANSS